MSHQDESYKSESMKARERELKKIAIASKTIGKIYTKKVKIPDDPYNSVIFIKPDADPQEAIKQFKENTILNRYYGRAETASIDVTTNAEAAVVDVKPVEKKS